jgi:hypothetical protein
MYQNITIPIYLQYIYNKIQYSVYIIFKFPFLEFYIKGPKFLGCWENREYEDICSSLTGNTGEFWRFNEDECKKIINNKFESYYIFITTIIYIALIYKIIQVFWWRYFIYKPMIHDIVKILNNSKIK